MGCGHQILFRVGLTIALLTGVSFLSEGHAKAPGATFKNIDPPEEQGPYNVGFTTFCATMTGERVTRILVFYPTLDSPDCDTKYPVYSTPTAAAPIPNLASCFPDILYYRRSELCAVKDAVPATNNNPMILNDHGGAAVGADWQRFSQVPLQETLASHGFITVQALHSGVGSFANWIPDLKLVIDTMLARNATSGDLLFGRIDPDRIGISGLSAGGVAALLMAGGSSSANPPITADPRIKAMVVYEPGFPNFDAANITFPYLVMGGTQNISGLQLPDLFDATVSSIPRIYVLNPNAVHISYATGTCPLIDDAREYALENDPSLRDPNTQELTTEPLTHFDTGSRVCKSGTGPAARQACATWNMGRLSAAPPICNIADPLTFGFGGGRNYCNRVGVNSSESLDVDTDGFTDPLDPLTGSALFSPTDECTLEPPIPEEILVPMIKLYTVAFFKKFLEGDDRYMRYLTPGYTKTQNLQAVVEIRE